MERWAHLCALVIFGAAISSASTTDKPRRSLFKSNHAHLRGGRVLDGFQNAKDSGLEQSEVKEKNNSAKSTDTSQRGYNGWPAIAGIGPVLSRSNGWPAHAGIGPVLPKSNGWSANPGIGPASPESNGWQANAGIGPVQVGSNGLPFPFGPGPVQVGSNGLPFPFGLGPVQEGVNGWPGIGPVQIGDSSSPMHQSPVRQFNMPGQQTHPSYMTSSDNRSPNNGPLSLNYVPQLGPQGSYGMPGIFASQAFTGQEGQGPQYSPSSVPGFNQAAPSPTNLLGAVANLPQLVPLGNPGSYGSLSKAPSFPPHFMQSQRFLLLPSHYQDSRVTEQGQQGANQSPPDLASAARAYISPGTYYPAFQGNPFAPPPFFGPMPSSMPSRSAQQLPYSTPNLQQLPVKFPPGTLPFLSIPVDSHPFTSFKKEH